MSEEAIKYCKKILPKVSRSFAITIPMLDAEIKLPVLITYLQDRLLDNFEDEISDQDISIDERKKMMDKVVELFTPDVGDVEEVAREISEYAELMPEKSLQDLTENALIVRWAYDSLGEVAKSLSFKWLEEMNRGMKKYLTHDVRTFVDLDEYCYYVAGTVGGFLTDVVIFYSSISEEESDRLLANYNASGLFLQKVNLIRDIKKDIENREKHYWPLTSLKTSIRRIMDKENKKEGMSVLAAMIDDVKNHIPNLISYYHSIPREMKGYRKFYSVNNALGLATIEKLEGNEEVLYGKKPVKVSKIELLSIIKDPEKHFLDHVERHTDFCV
ncbi:MAG: squalene/phytoene synthase family protein [Halanaerobiales bacterium]